MQSTTTQTIEVYPLTFAEAKRVALTAQRDRERARLEALRADIRKLIARLDSGVITDPTLVDAAFAKLERLGQAERRYLDTITRLNHKIGV